MDMSFENQGLFAPAETGPGLRRMTWHELCSRIAAVQDFRRLMSVSDQAEGAISTGSFDGRTARIIASGFSGFSGVSALQAEGEDLVNPTSSVNGKADPAHLDGQMTGVRSSRADVRV